MLHFPSPAIVEPSLLQSSAIRIGFSWDACTSVPAGHGIRNLDLDTTCLTYDDTGNLVDTVWFRDRSSRCGAIKHRGDDPRFVVDGEAMDEIVVDLCCLPEDISRIVFVINSLGPCKFDNVKSCSFEIRDLSTGTILASETQNATGFHKAFMTFALVRATSGWELRSIGQSFVGWTMDQTADAAARMA